jgi:D-glycero-D-manno-heptose 1,7-bisphosphate phosphatase
VLVDSLPKIGIRDEISPPGTARYRPHALHDSSTAPRSATDDERQGTNGVILLDRDGVLNVDLMNSVRSVADLRLERNAERAVALLVSAGFTLVVVTNQAAVGRGWLDEPTLAAIHEHLNEALGGRISRFYVCPHNPDERCRCRKPGTLLLEQAREDYGFDPERTWFVLDAPRDIEAATRFGCRPALVRTGKGAATERDHADVPVWDDLLAFADWLLANEDRA